MELRKFRAYQKKFEGAVMGELHALAVMKMIPVRPGRLVKTRFGALIGRIFSHDKLLVIDYYGFLKKSSALVERIESERAELAGRQVRMLKALVVHFASVRMEDVARLAPQLVSDFPDFKKTILRARGFGPK